MRRIGIDARGLNIEGGVKVYIKNLIDNLLALDFKNEYIVFCHSVFSSEIKIKEKRFLRFSHPYFKLFQDEFILPLACKQARLNLIHYLKNFSPFIKICKTIVTIHDIIPLTYPKMLEKIERIYWQKRIILALKYADKIIVPSYFVKHEILKKFKIKETKIEVIYEGCNERYKPINNYKILEKVREKYFLPSKFILSISTISKRKNYKALILAFANLIKKKNTPYKLVIGGRDGGNLKQIKQLIKNLNLEQKIIICGFISYKDLPYVYNLAEVFVFPSFSEGFGLPVLEAMACGIPVIVSSEGSLSEITGNAGIFINPKNFYEIEEAISYVLENNTLKENLIKKGLEQVKNFSWKKTAQRTLKIYEEI